MNCKFCQERFFEKHKEEARADHSKVQQFQKEAQRVELYCFECAAYLCLSCDWHVHQPQNQVQKGAKNNTATTKAPTTTSSADKTDILFLQKKGAADSEQVKGHNSKAHRRQYICMEVEGGDLAEFECHECEQRLCTTCWNKIHNKGGRIRHKKVLLGEPEVRLPSSGCKVTPRDSPDGDNYFGESNCSPLSEKNESPLFSELQVDDQFKGNRLSGRTPQYSLQQKMTPASNQNSNQGENNSNCFKGQQASNNLTGAQTSIKKQSETVENRQQPSLWGNAAPLKTEQFQSTTPQNFESNLPHRHYTQTQPNFENQPQIHQTMPATYQPFQANNQNQPTFVDQTSFQLQQSLLQQQQMSAYFKSKGQNQTFGPFGSQQLQKVGNNSGKYTSAISQNFGPNTTIPTNTNSRGPSDEQRLQHQSNHLSQPFQPATNFPIMSHFQQVAQFQPTFVPSNQTTFQQQYPQRQELAGPVRGNFTIPMKKSDGSDSHSVSTTEAGPSDRFEGSLQSLPKNAYLEPGIQALNTRFEQDQVNTDLPLDSSRTIETPQRPQPMANLKSQLPCSEQAPRNLKKQLIYNGGHPNPISNTQLLITNEDQLIQQQTSQQQQQQGVWPSTSFKANGAGNNNFGRKGQQVLQVDNVNNFNGQLNQCSQKGVQPTNFTHNQNNQNQLQNGTNPLNSFKSPQPILLSKENGSKAYVARKGSTKHHYEYDNLPGAGGGVPPSYQMSSQAAIQQTANNNHIFYADKSSSTSHGSTSGKAIVNATLQNNGIQQNHKRNGKELIYTTQNNGAVQKRNVSGGGDTSSQQSGESRQEKRGDRKRGRKNSNEVVLETEKSHMQGALSMENSTHLNKRQHLWGLFVQQGIKFKVEINQIESNEDYQLPNQERIYGQIQKGLHQVNQETSIAAQKDNEQKQVIDMAGNIGIMKHHSGKGRTTRVSSGGLITSSMRQQSAAAAESSEGVKRGAGGGNSHKVTSATTTSGHTESSNNRRSSQNKAQVKQNSSKSGQKLSQTPVISPKKHFNFDVVNQISIQQPLRTLSEVPEISSGLQKLISSHMQVNIETYIYNVQLLLFEMAESGELLIDKNDFFEKMISKFDYTQERCEFALKLTLDLEIVHETVRNFTQTKRIELVSLKIETMSLQLLSWVITSLKRDDMTPLDSAIKKRMKEAFAFKELILNGLWESVIATIEHQSKEEEQVEAFNQSNSTERGESAAILTPQISQGQSDVTNNGGESSINSSKDDKATKLARKNFSFKIVILNVNAESNQLAENKVRAIYPIDDEIWQGVDIDDKQTVDLELFELMKNFLQEFFFDDEFMVLSDKKSESTTNHQQSGTTAVVQSSQQKQVVATAPKAEIQSTERDCGSNQVTANATASSSNQQQQRQSDQNNSEKGNLSSQDGVRNIPGGRYGCTQFLKICGPPQLRACSVGKLTQMVHHAITQDVLRHHKTLLVWASQVDKYKNQNNFEDQKAKLRKVKECIIQILQENPEGLSLAQMPQNLKKILNIELHPNELGFPKLKDLLHSMQDEGIKVEHKDKNHPYAFLMRTSNDHSNQDQQMQTIERPSSDNSSQQHTSEEKWQQPLLPGFSTNQNQEAPKVEMSVSAAIFQATEPQNQLLHQNRIKRDESVIRKSQNLNQLLCNVHKLLQLKESEGIHTGDLERLLQIMGNFNLADYDCNNETELIERFILPAGFAQLNQVQDFQGRTFQVLRSMNSINQQQASNRVKQVQQGIPTGFMSMQYEKPNEIQQQLLSTNTFEKQKQQHEVQVVGLPQNYFFQPSLNAEQEEQIYGGREKVHPIPHNLQKQQFVDKNQQPSAYSDGSIFKHSPRSPQQIYQPTGPQSDEEVERYFDNLKETKQQPLFNVSHHHQAQQFMQIPPGFQYQPQFMPNYQHMLQQPNQHLHAPVFDDCSTYADKKSSEYSFKQMTTFKKLEKDECYSMMEKKNRLGESDTMSSGVFESNQGPLPFHHYVDDGTQSENQMRKNQEYVPITEETSGSERLDTKSAKNSDARQDNLEIPIQVPTLQNNRRPNYNQRQRYPATNSHQNQQE